MHIGSTWHASLLFAFVLAACGQTHEFGETHDVCPEPESLCFGGVCCHETASAIVDDVTCETSCPGETSLTCTPSPSAFCVPECEEPADCQFRRRDCCPGCTADEEDYIALTDEEAREHDSACAAVRCPSPMCRELTRPTVRATCQSEVCVLEDFATPRYLDCEVDADCTLALDGCCGCGGEYVSVATRALSRFEELVCPNPVDAICPDCEPTPIGSTLAVCRAGQCTTILGER